MCEYDHLADSGSRLPAVPPPCPDEHGLATRLDHQTRLQRQCRSLRARLERAARATQRCSPSLSTLPTTGSSGLLMSLTRKNGIPTELLACLSSIASPATPSLSIFWANCARKRLVTRVFASSVLSAVIRLVAVVFCAFSRSTTAFSLVICASTSSLTTPSHFRSASSSRLAIKFCLSDEPASAVRPAIRFDSCARSSATSSDVTCSAFGQSLSGSTACLLIRDRSRHAF